MATYRYNIPSGGTEITAATLNNGCSIENFSTSSDTTMQDIVSDFSFDGTNIRITASTNSTTSQREGYMTLSYRINGNDCSNVLHFVQSAAPQPKVLLTLTNGNVVRVDCGDSDVLSALEVRNAAGGDKANIREAEIKECVTRIGTSGNDATFAYSYSLTSVTIPNSVVEIGQDAFESCSGLTSVTIPDSVRTMAWDSFARCRGLTAVTIGSGIVDFGTRTFQYCNNLKSITLRATTPPTLGDDYTFSDCHSDLKIYVPSGSVSAYRNNTSWQSQYLGYGTWNVNNVIQPIS